MWEESPWNVRNVVRSMRAVSARIVNRGPEIIVNNADYLRRKEAYEKKQGWKRVCSSHTDKPQKEPEEKTADDRRAVKKKPQEQPEYEEIDYLGMMKKVYDTGKEAAGSAAEELKKRKGFFSRYRKRIIAACWLYVYWQAADLAFTSLLPVKIMCFIWVPVQRFTMLQGWKIIMCVKISRRFLQSITVHFTRRSFHSRLMPMRWQIRLQATTGNILRQPSMMRAVAQYALYTWKDGQDAVQVSKNAMIKISVILRIRKSYLFRGRGCQWGRQDLELCSYMYTMRPESLHS